MCQFFKRNKFITLGAAVTLLPCLILSLHSFRKGDHDMALKYFLILFLYVGTLITAYGFVRQHQPQNEYIPVLQV